MLEYNINIRVYDWEKANKEWIRGKYKIVFIIKMYAVLKFFDWRQIFIWIYYYDSCNKILIRVINVKIVSKINDT